MISSSSIANGADGGASRSIQTQEGVSAAKADLDHVAIFTRFIKKAEEAAQSAI
ncbi:MULTISPECIES: hypothetical protein [Herbaspirillum]|uniref:hypothetical protein n=1 Tax=Herbaspirillum TaxID=963 RepID=UPI00030B6BCA|nr:MULTISPECIES: hypothetical protein [Herbaspirillum]MCP1572653.1 hypothetical protein [Herbaspirillum rubrisubalbicans]